MNQIQRIRGIFCDPKCASVGTRTLFDIFFLPLLLVSKILSMLRYTCPEKNALFT